MQPAPGTTLPDAHLVEIGPDGPRPVALADFTRGRRVVLFAVPGAFTPTCHAAHVPSFVRNAAALAEAGVDEIACISVNDPFVMQAWGQQTGAAAAGIRMLADADGSFTRAIGLDFSAPPVGLIGRSRRYAMLVEDGVVAILNLEDSPGTCAVSAGETLLAQLKDRPPAA